MVTALLNTLWQKIWRSSREVVKLNVETGGKNVIRKRAANLYRNLLLKKYIGRSANYSSQFKMKANIQNQIITTSRPLHSICTISWRPCIPKIQYDEVPFQRQMSSVTGLHVHVCTRESSIRTCSGNQGHPGVGQLLVACRPPSESVMSCSGISRSCSWSGH